MAVDLDELAVFQREFTAVEGAGVGGAGEAGNESEMDSDASRKSEKRGGEIRCRHRAGVAGLGWVPLPIATPRR